VLLAADTCVWGMGVLGSKEDLGGAPVVFPIVKPFPSMSTSLHLGTTSPGFWLVTVSQRSNHAHQLPLPPSVLVSLLCPLNVRKNSVTKRPGSGSLFYYVIFNHRFNV